MPSEIIYSWKKLNEGEYCRKILSGDKERVFLLKTERCGVLGIGKCFTLTTKLVSESSFSHVINIVYAGDNHGLQIHNDITKRGEEWIDENDTDSIHLIFAIADNYVERLYT